MQTYNRYLSTFAMAAGFIADTIFFGRIDVWATHIVFVSYTVICFVAIALLHLFEARATLSQPFSRWRMVLPVVIQFALGGFWSGFVIFYGHSASFGASWPFFLLLLLVFIGNEYFYRYHSRLVFTSVLFFFALFSYTIFAVPIYTGTISTQMFFVSGVLAVGIFALFTILLKILARERFLADVWRIRVGAGAVFVLMNVFYFTSVLPPLPLSAEASGVYHSVWRVPGAYMATSEVGQSWQVRYLGFPPTMHIASGEWLSAYSSIFAPTTLTTTIVHQWQWYDPTRKSWVTRAKVSYPIVGGRDGGYRGYSAAFINEKGEWRINIETEDGRLIARVPFIVAIGATVPSTETITLK